MSANENVQTLVQTLGTDLHNGLPDSRVEQSIQQYGSNVLTPTPKPSLLSQYLAKFKDPTIIILCIAAAVSIALGFYTGHFVEGIGIIAAVLVATGVGFYSEYRSNNEFELLAKVNEDIRAKVTRSGQFRVISINEVVVGDLIHLEMGDKVPADGAVVRSVDLSVNESLMTGESTPVRKSDDDPGILRGTVVEEGSGAAIVTAVGDRTKIGQIKDSLATDQPETPLQEKLADLAEKIGRVGTVAALLIFGALLLVSLAHAELPLRSGAMLGIGLAILGATIFFMGVIGQRGLIAGVVVCLVLVGAAIASGELRPEHIALLLGFFLVAVTVVVVAVPEGLPMAVTVSLAFSMRKIAQDGNLVRKLVATETIGSANVIASDKTGTLTKNQMTVQEVYLHGHVFAGSEARELRDQPAYGKLALAAAANSTAHLEISGDKVTFVGNSTEGALLAWLYAQGTVYEEIRESAPVIERRSFTADRKMMTSVVDEGGALIGLTKGAPDRVLALCDYVETDQGVEPIAAYKDEIVGQIDRMAESGMRTLALAYRTLPDASYAGQAESSLTLLAIVAITDPVREDVAAAIEECHLAGIDVKMVTGDHVKTARAIAGQIGLLERDSVVLSGSEFRELPPERMQEILPKLRVIARAEPLDKLKLVEALQEAGLVVAVTGDGTNDAPALKRADVGISMGKSGTDVAKEASDIVLLNDDFGSIVRAVHWGRALFENIQKFIQFQLTVNVSALTIAFLGALFGFGLPLTVIQLLWVNLIMDTLAAIALGLEPPTPGLMRRKPKRRDDPMITRSMWWNILSLSAYFLVCILALLQFSFLGGKDEAERLTIVFATFVFFQVFNQINCRSLDPSRSGLAGLNKSPAFLGVVGGIAVLTVLLVEFGGQVFRTTPLPLDIWVKIILFTSTALIYGEVTRLIRLRLLRQEPEMGLKPATT